MSLYDWIKRRVKPHPPITPVTPPAPPPIDPEWANRRADAIHRRARDAERYKAFIAKAQETGFLPPAPPSPNWYESHPEYQWNPKEPRVKE